MSRRRQPWILLPILAIVVLIALALALPRLRRPRDVGGINAEWRRERCLGGQELGLEPRWIEGTYTNIRGDSWERPTVCELSLPDGAVVFHDGCSGQVSRPRPPDGETWGMVHHDACVWHDHCYHHNPKTYGKDKATCDREFRDDMLATCAARFQGDERARCERAARKMYWGVVAGSPWFFEYSGYPAPYDGLRGE